MKFLTVKNLNGTTTLINLNHIIAIMEESDNARIYLRDGQWVDTIESFSQIFNSLSEKETF